LSERFASARGQRHRTRLLLRPEQCHEGLQTQRLELTTQEIADLQHRSVLGEEDVELCVHVLGKAGLRLLERGTIAGRDVGGPTWAAGSTRTTAATHAGRDEARCLTFQRRLRLLLRLHSPLCCRGAP